jgi:hypothetical protein
LWHRHFFRKMFNALTMEFYDLPWARPNALSAVRAALVDNPDLRFEKLNGVLRTHTDAASAEIAFPGNKIDH